MNHPHEQQLVDLYWGSISPEVDSHLSGCGFCRSRLAGLKELLDGVRTAPTPEPDAFFESRVWANVQAELNRSRSKRRYLFATAAAVLACLLVLSVLYVTNRPSPAIRKNEALEASLGRHLERVQILLTELEYEGADTADRQAERRQALQLLRENRKLRAQLSPSTQPLQGSLLAEVESALATVAGQRRNTQFSPSDSATDSDQDGLIFKIRVTRANLPGISNP